MFEKSKLLSLLLLPLLPLLASCATVSSQAPELDPKNTYAVITGVLEWPSKTLSSYSKENRRDQGLYDELKNSGVPEKNMILLLGKDATNAKMLEAIKSVAKRAPKGSTFIFYYAGHGYPGSKGTYFASYDAGSKKVPEGFLLNDIATILKKDFRGSNVLLMADCCYSGALADVAKDLSTVGFRAGILSSASNANSSTGQWTFTCTVIDVFGGRPLLDLDGDGYISMAEAGNDVTEAMIMIENQRSGYSLHGMDKSFRLSKVNPKEQKPAPVQEPFELRQYVTVPGSKRSWVARIIGFRNGKLKLEVQHYHSREIDWRTPKEVMVLKRPKFKELPERPKPLSPELADKKATVNGKYSKLLKKIRVEHDYMREGAFTDYGIWRSTAYAGYKNLPVGYWVYVYPNWYIFKEKTLKSEK